jgi:hypothetical protein
MKAAALAYGTSFDASLGSYCLAIETPDAKVARDRLLETLEGMRVHIETR